MKTWIVSSLDEETIQGRKLHEEIRYLKNVIISKPPSNQIWLAYIFLSEPNKKKCPQQSVWIKKIVLLYWISSCIFCKHNMLNQFRLIIFLNFQSCFKWVVGNIVYCTGYSLSEALIFASINPKYDGRLFVELRV